MIYIDKKGFVFKNRIGDGVTLYRNSYQDAFWSIFKDNLNIRTIYISRSDIIFRKRNEVYYCNAFKRATVPILKVLDKEIWLNRDFENNLIFKPIKNRLKKYLKEDSRRIKYISSNEFSKELVEKVATERIYDEKFQKREMKKFKSHVMRVRYLESRGDTLNELNKQYE